MLKNLRTDGNTGWLRNMFSIIRSKIIFSKLNAVELKHVSDVRSFTTAKYALLAGHSKWANIRHIKAAKDGQKAVLFTKFARQIRLAIQDGGNADPNLNTLLRSVIDDALRSNMPMATIQNNIKKSQQSKNELKRYRLDLRYKQKVFAVCVIYTDNYAATKMEIAPVLRKSGAIILDANHLFNEFGLIQAVVDKTRKNVGNDFEESVTDDAIMCGAEEVEIIDKDMGSVNFICRPFELMQLRKSIEQKGYDVDNTEHIYIPLNNIELIPEELVEYQKFITKLKDIHGVEEIYDNIVMES